MTRFILTLAAHAIALQTLALAGVAEPSTTVPPPPDEHRIRDFPLVNALIFKARRGLSFECPDAFPVEQRGVMSAIKLPSGSEFDVHVFACEPDISPLDPNFIAESLDPAMAANFPRLKRLGLGTPFEHPLGKAARYRFSGTYGEGDDKQVVIGVVYALVKGDSAALLITECPVSGELPSMEIMQPIFRTFTFAKPGTTKTPEPAPSTPDPATQTPTLPHSVDLATGAKIAYPDGFTPSVDHHIVTFKPVDPSGPVISVVDRLHGSVYPGTLLRAMVGELQDQFPTFHRTEDPVITPTTITAKIQGQVDGQDRIAVVRAVIKGKRTLRLILSGTPEQVKALEPALERMVTESTWPAPEQK